MTEAPDALREAVLHEALIGLSALQKTLTPWLFYDAAGSHLFDQITTLPEYYLTRTERAIFRQYGPELPQLLGTNVTIAELGAGSASKTGILLKIFSESQTGVLYQPIDISPTSLDEAKASITAAIPGVQVEPQVANYITEGYVITRPSASGDKAARVLALYIGSSVGNFSRDEANGILRNLRNHLEPGDYFLLGTDLAPSAHKSVQQLIEAYDDAAGVTAAFNKNVLARLNRELEADFDLGNFAHQARWNAEKSRIEMHLESLTAQTVHIEGRRIAFEQGETIHTESSYKFTEESLGGLMSTAGFHVERIFSDDDHRFAVTLATAM